MNRWKIFGPNTISRPGAALTLLHVFFVLWNAGTFFGLSLPTGWGFAAGYAALFLATCFLVAVQKPDRVFLWGVSLHIFLPAWFALIVHTRLISLRVPGELHYHLYAGFFIFTAMAGMMWLTVRILMGEGSPWEEFRKSPLGSVAAPVALATILLPASLGVWGWSLTALALAAGALFFRGRLTFLDSVQRRMRGKTVKILVVLILCLSAIMRIVAVTSLNRTIDEFKLWGRASFGQHHAAKLLAIDPAALLRSQTLKHLGETNAAIAKVKGHLNFAFESKPGYMLVLGLVYFMTRPEASIGRWLNMVFSLLTLWMTFLIVRSLWDEKAALIALALHASSAHMLWVGVYIDELVLALLLFQVSVYVLTLISKTGSTRKRLILGLAFGFSFGLFALTRTDNMPLLIAYGILLLVWVRRQGMIPLAAAALVVSLLWGAWGLRNQKVWGEFRLTNIFQAREIFRGGNPHLARMGYFQGERLSGIFSTFIKQPVASVIAIAGAPVTWERLRKFFDRSHLAIGEIGYLNLFHHSLYSVLFFFGLDVAAVLGLYGAMRCNWGIATGYLLVIGYRVTTMAVLYFKENYRTMVEPLILTFAACGLYLLFQKTVGHLVAARRKEASMDDVS